MFGQQQGGHRIDAHVFKKEGGLDLPDGLFGTRCRFMQHTRRIYRPVDFTDLRRPVLDSDFIGEVQLMPGDFGLIGLRRLAVAGHGVLLVVRSDGNAFHKSINNPA